MNGPVLAIDTAGSRCSVALVASDGRALASRDPDLGRGHAERLMGLVGEVLEEAGATYGDLSRIAVSVGPGSFTGLRVGVAAARGLALALGLPAVGVSTLEALAEPFRSEGPALAAIDARRGEVWLAGFGPGDAVFLPPASFALDALAESLEKLPARPVVIVGSGAAIVAGSLPGSRVANGEGRIDILALARIAMRRSAGEAPRPLYLRGADAKPQRIGLSVRDSLSPDLAPNGPGGR